VDAVDERQFESFFIRRVVESTPYALGRPSELAVNFRWFLDADRRQPANLDARPIEALWSETGLLPSLGEIEEALLRPSDELCLSLARNAGAMSRCLLNA
jgi:hypothetical protein